MAPPSLPGEEVTRVKQEIIRAIRNSKNLSLEAARLRKQLVQLEAEVQCDNKTLRIYVNSDWDAGSLAKALKMKLRRRENKISFVKDGIEQAHDKRETIEHRMVQRWKDYRKLHCYMLCYSARQLLPRELREMIYRYMFEGERVIIGQHAAGIAKPLESLPVLPNYIPDNNTLGALSTEIVEACYLSATFVLKSHVYLDTFLCNDWWDLDLLPKQNISNVEINVCRRDLDPYPQNPVSMSEGFYISPEDQTAILKKSMRALRSLKTNASIVMNLDFQPRVSLGFSDFDRNRLHLYLNVLSSVISEVHDKQGTAMRDIKIFIRNHFDPAQVHEFMKSNRLEKTAGGFYVCEKGVHS
ncbi:hypothetical protein HBH70_127920 [Parastagonospora nodorum]|nr:hypothetical protein HBH53_180990 [Parastagonospora nodorum]KAH3981490.1 hypothetical protein HBH52_088340 [Parastagonospora nodorum]KAH4003204.1 hypothetical protein HBI10_064520 [Parastagonospora nodorum]KAH4022833.1 hypothetical protein HBI09_168380 [Parastagonospora nodorum]KAH4028309.1 hypothetical protein HBI13_053510 [Parastagonospora nodorum]